MYGKEKDFDLFVGKKEDRKWNGRVVFIIGIFFMVYIEVEEGLVDLRGWWLGKENVRMVRM